MKGFVPTPRHVVDHMVAKLFAIRPPEPGDRLLDPGCGTGALIEGVIRWCEQHHKLPPAIVGVESDPAHLLEARRTLDHLPSVTLVNQDFLSHRSDRFDFVIGNPPYVPITGLSDAEKARYRTLYRTATGRFDLYLLFFEQALTLLKPGGRLVFITPEKFLYVRSAEPLRKQLAAVQVEEIEFVAETTFDGLTTYPTITTLANHAATTPPPPTPTRVRLRDGQTREVRLGGGGASWLPAVSGRDPDQPSHTLVDACLRISCGVATGADGVYITRTSALPAGLTPFAYPTVAGRDIAIGEGMSPAHSMLIPYAPSGDLLREDQLGELGEYLSQPERRARLLRRTCVARKRWYAFHENPPLTDILRPKILCKDISSRPYFLIDETGDLVPRHSVYYLVPKVASRIHELCDYLNSEVPQSWLLSHCQRAANGFLRLQSHVLKALPLPATLASTPRLELAPSP